MEAVLLHFSDLISGSKNITTEQVSKQVNADYISGVRAHYNFEPLKKEQGKSVDLEKPQETLTQEKHYDDVYSYDYLEDYGALSENYFYPVDGNDTNILDTNELEKHAYEEVSSTAEKDIYNVPEYKDSAADIDYGVVQYVVDEDEFVDDNVYSWNEWESKRI